MNPRARVALTLSLLVACQARKQGVATPPAPALPSAPAAPVLRGATVLSSAPGETPRLRALGQAPDGARIELFVDVACTGPAAASGTSARLESPGIDVPVPAGQRALKLFARSVSAADATRVSACTPPFELRLQGEVEPADAGAATSSASAVARAGWQRATEAQESLAKVLPAPVAAALAEAKLVPVALLSRLPRSQAPLVSGDYDCDGKPDVALVVLPQGSRLGAALARPRGQHADLEALVGELRRIALDGGSDLAVVSTRGAGDGDRKVFTRPGNGLAASGKYVERDLCLPDAKDRADLAWLQGHACDVLEYLEGERAGSGVLVWDARSAGFVALPDRCHE